MSEEEDPQHFDDIFRILVATDIHMGFAENDPVRGNDTFDTFEEILQHAVNEQVDFILLGGDLFHETRPSVYCINRCTELMRKYCLGDKPVQVEFMSDPSDNFTPTQAQVPLVNYEDPNLNVSYPIFSIHGNHDDPTGKKQMSALNLLSSMGLVNYFGRWDDLTHIEIQPILLCKGKTRLALYGLSHIRDDRLSRLLLDGKVVMHPPEGDDWFNLLVWHQNRADRGAKNFIPESSIPAFMDLVIWGHEHDCRIEAVVCKEGRVYISQPGSSVATSLAAGEALPKKIGVLLVKGQRDFKIEPIELKTVRPFIFKDTVLELPSDEYMSLGRLLVTNPNLMENAQKHVDEVIEAMIVEAQALGRADNLIPLIRLIIRYKDERQIFNVVRYGHKYVDRVANPQDMVKFALFKNVKNEKKTYYDPNFPDEVDHDHCIKLEDFLSKFYNENNKMNVLTLSGLTDAISGIIKSNNTDALQMVIEYQEKETAKMLEKMAPTDDEVENCLRRILGMREKEEGDDIKKLLNDPVRIKVNTDTDDVIIIDCDDHDDDSSETGSTSGKITIRGRGRGSRGRGRGSRVKKNH